VKSASAKSRHHYKCVEYGACSFLLRLQKQGVSSLEQITGKDVLDVFNNDDRIRQSYRYKNVVAAAFKICAPFCPACSNVLSCLPAIQSFRKNIQYLAKDEIKSIKSVLEDDTTLSLQNKAIGLLAFYTGLRSGDIAALTLEQIDRENDLIHIIPQKTEIPKVLPLRAIVGNAIFDHITKERPKSSEKTVFLTANAPYRRLHTVNLNFIM
jgi:integrase